MATIETIAIWRERNERVIGASAPANHAHKNT